MIQTAKVDKIYEQLNPEQLAALGFEATISCNEIEFNRIDKVLDKSDYFFTQKYRNRSISIQVAAIHWVLIIGAQRRGY